MLDITILKVMHGGVEEARKLAGPISECDVYSPERSGASNAGAQWEEESWRKCLASGINRSAYNRLRGSEVSTIGLRPAQIPFFMQKWDSLFRSRRAVYYIERWEDTSRLPPVFLDFEEGSVVGYYEALCRLVRRDKARERNMAENLATAEEKIRWAYPDLRVKDPLKFTIELGYMHRLEDLVPGAKVVSLVDERSLSNVKGHENYVALIARLREGASFEEVSAMVSSEMQSQAHNITAD